MTLRDRIAAVISSTTRVEECADAILADPEIAALREVAEAARAHRDEEVRYGKPSLKSKQDIYAALARLEEAQRG